jgi:hypothetical protein
VITFFIKFTLAFSLSYFLMTIPISGKQVFWHLYDITGPIGGKVTKELRTNINQSYEKTKKLGRQFFENSQPRSVAPINAKHKKIIQERRKRRADSSHQDTIYEVESKAMDELIKENL